MDSTLSSVFFFLLYIMVKNSMSYFFFAFLFTFLLSTFAHEIPNNGERIPNYAWPNEFEDSSRGSIGYYDLQEANNPSLVSKSEKGDYSTTSEYQLDKSKTTIGISFPGGRIYFPWPFSSSMIMAPIKTETTPFYTATSATWSGPSNQHSSGFIQNSEDPTTENRRRMKKKNRKLIMKPQRYETRSMTNGGKANRDIDDEYQPEW
ncbi:hypothetical protein PIB30_000468 [Stylosanthes scabra]|uniref:Uncharacterized protein n=1 Tax=Stylosanthes scabra TaxID=79078 RepID=A0ABU6V2U2_9FABA|nr:hypothetical protein [Stylosanthes scabra]